jgi:hypothetical protein
VLRSTAVADAIGATGDDDVQSLLGGAESPDQLIAALEAEMLEASKKLEFERAASLRDRIDEVRDAMAAATAMGVGGLDAGGARARRRTAKEPRRRAHRYGENV